MNKITVAVFTLLTVGIVAFVYMDEDGVPDPVLGAVTFSTPNEFTDDGGAGPFTDSHTVSSGEILLVVAITIYDTSATDGVVSGVTFGGVALTKGTQYYDSLSDGHVSLWYLQYPEVSTADISVSIGGSVTNFMASSVNVTPNTAGNGFIVDSIATPATGTTGDVTISWTSTSTPVVNFAAALDDQREGAKVTVTETEMHHLDLGSDTVVASYDLSTSGTAQSMTFPDGDGDEDWVIVAMAFSENASPTTALDTADLTDFDTDTTPTLEFTGTDDDGDEVEYQIEIDTVDTFDSQVGVIDSYDWANSSGGNFLDDVEKKFAQSFTGDGNSVMSVSFEILGWASPTGNITAAIYEHSGTFGTDSEPTGTALATSNAVDASTISTADSEVIEFTFSTPYTTTDSVKYCVSIEWGDGDATNRLSVSWDTSSPTHAGNYSRYTTSWINSSASDLSFYLYSEIPLISADSSVPDAGFANTVTPADTHPFIEGEKADYDVQSGDALTTDTYYWRVRAKDPLGLNEWADWATTREFYVDTGGAPAVEPVYQSEFFF